MLQNRESSMTVGSSLLQSYLEHLQARVRARSNTPDAGDQEAGVLPAAIRRLSTDDPEACLALIVEALHQVSSPHLIQAAGEELLEDLLNEHSAALDAQIATLLRNDQRFRFAFASGTYSSVDPSLLDDWMRILQSLGTTKQNERKRLWAMPFHPETRRPPG
jgi:DNA-binding transcriptional MerR regulator